MRDPAKIQSFVDRFSGPAFEETMNGFLGSMFGPTTPEAVKSAVRAMMKGATQQVAVSAMKGMLDLAIWTDDPIHVPLLVLVAKSPAWNAEYFAYVKTLNPAAEIVEVPDAAHFVMMEKPAEVNAALVAFAARAGAVPMRAVRPGPPATSAPASSRNQFPAAPLRRDALVGRDDLLGGRVRGREDPGEVPPLNHRDAVAEGA